MRLLRAPGRYPIPRGWPAEGGYGQLPIGLPTHCPPRQASVSVQASPSSQLVPSLALSWLQPPSGEQASAVQGLPSSQSFESAAGGVQA